MKFLPHPQQLAQSTYHVILPHQSAAAAVNGTALSTGMLKQPFKWGHARPPPQVNKHSFRGLCFGFGFFFTPLTFL